MLSFGLPWAGWLLWWHFNQVIHATTNATYTQTTSDDDDDDVDRYKDSN